MLRTNHVMIEQPLPVQQPPPKPTCGCVQCIASAVHLRLPFAACLADSHEGVDQGLTSASRLRTRRLNSADFPTFGRPTNAICGQQ